MIGEKELTASDLRARLAIPSTRLDDLNALLLDPDTRVVNDLLEVVARYGTPEEINRKAREAGAAAGAPRPRPGRPPGVPRGTSTGWSSSATAAPSSPWRSSAGACSATGRIGWPSATTWR